MNPELRRSAAHAFVDDLDAPELNDADRHHLLRVMRLRDGEVVTVSDGRGSWRSCRLLDGGELDVDGSVIDEPAPTVALTVGFAMPRGDRLELTVQKLTELGVDRIALLHCERSVTRWDTTKAAKQTAKLALVAREASMQSRRTRLPSIAAPVDVIAYLRALDPSELAAVACAEPQGPELQPSVSTVLVGPEGGWTAAELDAAPRLAGLGETILRIETAALVAGVALTQMRRGSG